MIRRGPKLHSLYPAKLEDHLLADFGSTDFDICLQACAIPRWFNLEILERALLHSLGKEEIAGAFERILKEDYVKSYGDTGFFFSDPERYFFLNFAFYKDAALGEEVLKNISQYFREMSEQPIEEFNYLRSRGYYESRGAFRIEYLHLQLYDTSREVRNTTELAFRQFCEWRAEPVFNHGLNRRLVKALRDHVKTGVIDDLTSQAILDLMEYSTPPWSDRSFEKASFLLRNERHLEGVHTVLPFYLLERAKSDAASNHSVSEDRTRRLFERSRELFQKSKSTYYVAETLRQEGKFLTLVDEFDEADRLLRCAIRTLEDVRSFSSQFTTTIHECWRLLAWNQFYRGGDGAEIARSIAEEKYLELSKEGWKYMTSLFGILLAQVRSSDPSFFEFGELFFDTRRILEDAISSLVAIPDSVDYANALFQKLTFDIEYYDSRAASSEEKNLIENKISDQLFEVRTCYESLGSIQGLANVTYWEGRLYFSSGRYSSARDAFKSALSTYSSNKDQFGQLNTFVRLGTVSLALNEFEDAVTYFSNAWDISSSRKWQDRYERNLSSAISRNPSLEANLVEVDQLVRGGR